MTISLCKTLAGCSWKLSKMCKIRAWPATKAFNFDANADGVGVDLQLFNAHLHTFHAGIRAAKGGDTLRERLHQIYVTRGDEPAHRPHHLVVADDVLVAVLEGRLIGAHDELEVDAHALTAAVLVGVHADAAGKLEVAHEEPVSGAARRRLALDEVLLGLAHGSLRA